MPLPLALTAPGQLGHWWSWLRFHLQAKKDWSQVLDETFLLQGKRIDDIPLFFAAKENDVPSIRKLLQCPSTDMFQRGALGETALHVAVLFDNLEASVTLMEGVPDLINEPMTSDLYEGVTALHVAVLNQNVNLVHELIVRGSDVSLTRAMGWYFKKKRGGLFYFGEHVLSFAASMGNEEIVSMVIEAGADIRAQDSLGNTVLHILTLQPSKTISCQIFDLLMQLADRQVATGHRQVDKGRKGSQEQVGVSLDLLPNHRGLTPLKLAAKEGNLVMFQHMVGRRRRVQWSLGPVTSTLYDLTEIDSWSDRRSVLELIVSSSNREARRVLEVTPVRQLASLKWQLYGQLYFRCLLLLYLLYLGCFTLCCFYRPLQPVPSNYTLEYPGSSTIYIQKPLQESYISHEDHLRLIGEIFSVVGALVILLLEIPNILHVGAKRYFGQTVLGGPFHVILIGYACLVLVILVLRLTSSDGEMVVMAIALVLGWCNVMYFARGFEMLGPYMIMIQKIIFGDLTKFIWLSILVLMGFSTALWMVYMTQDPSAMPPYSSFPVSLFSQFELSVGLVDLPVDHTLRTPAVVHVLHVCFSVVSYLLLLNLLIAMMSDTHWRVAQERDEVWRAQVVATTIMLERRLPRWLWPRLGVSGRSYGLGDNWYLRVEERNDQAVQKIRRYAKVFRDKREGLVTQEAVKEKGRGQELDITRKSLRGWQLIRRSALGSEVMEGEGPEVEFSV
ncbi:transient receptor potential cation channel subfamily V member 6-like [Amia ocellicauda]|uniref:transient receptor potential cation channel subfamily V member 6-like n=1 Tax=Amia ocellicauda TaxID=2972642 RepID=UPI003464140B